MTHLIIFTIGPVQSFIAQARKTQDLFAGSQLLSVMARKAYELLEQETGKANIELIFPAFYNVSEDPVASNPNRFAVKVSNKTSSEINNACKNARQKLNDDFVDMAEELLKPLSNFGQVHSFSKIQLKNLLEIYWVAIEFADTNYHVQYVKLESYLGGIKNIRIFKQVKEQGRKCNVDGIRNALFYKHSVNTNGLENSKPHAVQNHYCKIPETDTRLIPGEGLSAVSMFKRLYKVDGNFPSTAKIALMELIDAINKNKEQKKLFVLYKKLFGENWDEQLLFEENLTDKYFSRQGLTEIAAGNGGIEKVIEYYFKPLQTNVGSFKPSYYAILVFDGDSMGEWISGSKLSDPATLLPFQQKMKDLLRNYGSWTMDYLNEPRGKAVYAGGDDFLGFVNLHHLYEVLKTMRVKFDEMINRPLQDEKVAFRLKLGNVFSFSAGISIAHYKQPLGLVLDEARKAEQIAKEYPGKNGFAISVIRHSGGTTTCVQPFGDIHSFHLKAMQFITSQLANGSFSNKFIHTLIKETRYWNEEILSEIFDIEAIRLIKRAKSPDTDIEIVNKMTEQWRILSAKGEILNQKAIENTTSTLRVCDFIYRCTKTMEEYENA